MIKKETSVKVKILLLKQGMTQKDLAKQLGVTQQRLNNVLNAKAESGALEAKIKEWIHKTER